MEQGGVATLSCLYTSSETYSPHRMVLPSMALGERWSGECRKETSLGGIISAFPHSLQ